jgi:hypothetical protein
MTYRNLIKDFFETERGRDSLIGALRFYHPKKDNLELVSLEKNKELLAMCKKAFYRRLSLKGIQFLFKDSDYSYLAVTPKGFFDRDIAKLALVEINPEENQERINFIDLETGEIRQGIYNHD